ncbi:MAG TPA: YhdP family protein [Lysobacter sp.]|nr:YhdP family protein [Lysobacter sp.]
MPTPVRRRLRLARRGLAYSVAVFLVLVAMVLGVASQLLPLAERHPGELAAWLSQRTGRVIAFDRAQTEWTRRGPLLQLENLRVGEGAQAFTIGDAEMLVSIYAGLLPGGSFSELRLRGLDLTLERLDDGRWQVRGLPGQRQAGGDPLAALEGLGELQVIGGKLAVLAPSLGIEATIPRVDLRLRVDGDRVRTGIRAWPAASALAATTLPIDASLDFDRVRGNGRAYAGALRADLAGWSSLLQLLGVTVEGGRGRAEAWAELRDHRVAVVTLDAALEDVVLGGIAPQAGQSRPHVQFRRVQTRARWRVTDLGWRLDAPTLRVADQSTMQTLDGLLLAGGEQYALVAERIDARPLLAVAALSNRLPPSLRRWMHAASPTATLHEVQVTGRRGGALSAQARIESLGFDAVGAAPGLQGLGGRLQGDGAGFVLQSDPAAQLRVHWPRSFAADHTFKLSGAITGWRDGALWRVGPPALRIAGDGFGAEVRGGLRWQGDGSRPWIDLAAAIDDADITVVKGFWLRNLMSPRLIEWLDTALVAGTIHDGRALISGDLDQWPFSSTNGRFEASARVAEATVRYQSGWPAAQGVDASLRFLGDGFAIDGTGAVAGVPIARLQAGIDHYREGTLTVQAHGGADASELLDLLRQSPLQQAHADTFANLSASGAAAVDFRFALPLKAGSVAALGGQVKLDNAKLADRRWKLAFDQVAGRIEYGSTGFRADQLRARHDGQLGRLALRAGNEYVRDRRNVFEAGLEVALTADDVLDRAPDLAWLKPYLEGRSAWTVGIAVPRSAPGGPTSARLQMSSSLVGTELTLPAPLDKPAAKALAATIDTPLPLGSGEVRVALGELMALRARSSKGQTGVRIAMGSSRVDQPPPVSGLVATGSAGMLDALDWIALAHGGRPDGAAAMPLQRVDITARRLHLLGGTFADTRLLVLPGAAGATSVRVDGASLAGALLVPGDSALPVSGRFDRVHWRSTASAPAPTKTPAAVASAAAPAGASSAPDPTRIPPLAIDIQDLRIGGAALGTASIRTRPTAAGMRIDQLQTRAPMRSVDLTGDWTGQGDTASTRIAVKLDSGDFGALLGEFGLGGQLAGGKGQVRFDAGWPGSPAEFALGELDGSLAIAARDGRLLEVEPGAGRVLGLLSLAELPRRLTLDFRDFFDKGFAFNQVDGTLFFADGKARSDDLVIDGPAAAISIRGTANLRSQSFNQTVEVRPKSANLLTAVGAIAGGPVGAAIGAAANAVLQKPLGQMGTKVYRVTGPWTDPKVEVISREQGRIAVPPKPAAG